MRQMLTVGLAIVALTLTAGYGWAQQSSGDMDGGGRANVDLGGNVDLDGPAVGDTRAEIGGGADARTGRQDGRSPQADADISSQIERRQQEGRSNRGGDTDQRSRDQADDRDRARDARDRDDRDRVGDREEQDGDWRDRDAQDRDWRDRDRERQEQDGDWRDRDARDRDDRDRARDREEQDGDSQDRDRDDRDRDRSDREGDREREDWRYRRYDGRLWYWTPRGHWMYQDDDGRWVRHPQSPQRPTDPCEGYEDGPRYDGRYYRDRYEEAPRARYRTYYYRGW